MVAMSGLVVDRGDPAVCVGTEIILRGGIGVSAAIGRAWLDDSNIQSFAVRLTHDLVERAVVGSIHRARRAVGRDTGRAAGGIDIARAFRPRGAHPFAGLLRRKSARPWAA